MPNSTAVEQTTTQLASLATNPVAAWLLAVILITIIFVIVLVVKKTVTLAMIVALIWGKIITTIYYILGIDITLASIYTVTTTPTGTPALRHLADITANTIIFLVMLSTNLFLVSIYLEQRRNPLTQILEADVARQPRRQQREEAEG